MSIEVTSTSHTAKRGLSTMANMVAIRCVAAVTGVTIVCPCVLADGQYTLTDIGNLFDGSTYPFAVNNAGQIVGMSFGDGFFAAPFLWEDGVIQELPTFGGQVSESGAGDITEDGVVVGWAATMDFHPPPFDSFEIHRAFILDRGRQTQLDALIPHGDSVARGVNTNGWVVGWGHSVLEIGAIQIRALLWVNEELTSLGTLGGTNSEAWDINGLNQIVGESGTGEGQTHAFLWQDGVMIDIDTFGTNQSVARAINDASQITGIWRNVDNVIRGFVWQDGLMTDLGTLGGMYTEPFGINDSGEIVGSSSTETALHGFIWRDGTMFDLNEMVAGGLPNNFVPRAISHNGRIVGSAFVDGNAHAYLLTPICPADLDGDGSVGASDLLALLIAWGPNPGHPADLDSDGNVGASDLLALLANWGPCP